MVCDVGTVNFCYLLFDEQTQMVIDFELTQLDKKRLVASTLELLARIATFDGCIIERQVATNQTCVKVQTAIECFCHHNGIRYTVVPAARKFAQLGVERPPKYQDRKRASVDYGSRVLPSVASPEIIARVALLKKKDDFFDCLLMALGELKIFKTQ